MIFLEYKDEEYDGIFAYYNIIEFGGDVDPSKSEERYFDSFFTTGGYGAEIAMFINVDHVVYAAFDDDVPLEVVCVSESVVGEADG